MCAFCLPELEIGREGVAALFEGVVFLSAEVLDDIMPMVVLGFVGRPPVDLVTCSALLPTKLKKNDAKNHAHNEPPGRFELPTPGLQDQCSNH